MDYYDELGVSRAASTDEIRQAYKMLARVLHPDQCADPRLRELAEIQMKRLNGMIKTLTDPVERRRYDAQMAGERQASTAVVVPPPVARRWRAGAIWIWLAGAGVGAAGAAWFIGRSEPATPGALARPAAGERRPSPAEPKRAKTEHREPAPPQSKPDAALTEELRAARRELERLQKQAKREQSAPKPPKPAVRASETPTWMEAPPVARESSGAWASGAPESPALAAPAGHVQAEAARSSPRFGGNWFYVSGSGQTRKAGVYVPEYIELRITEEAGAVRGKYRARYRVTDRPISPMVVFEFEGTGSAPAATLAWSGTGEASGQIALKLVSENVLEVNWRAHKLSEQLGLVSGTAVLVRELER